MTEQMEGQMSIFDLDIWCGKMSPEPSQATTVKTSEPFSKKRRGSRKATFLYLNLRTEDGRQQDASWETDGRSLGEYMTRNTGECPSEERESRLSQILEEKPHQKYFLSAKACQGILNRAKRRGKELPEMLKTALERQAKEQ